MMRSAAISQIIIQAALVLVFIRCGMIEAFAIDSCFIVPINSGQSKWVLSTSSPSDSDTSLTCTIPFCNHLFLEIRFPILLCHKGASLSSSKEAREHF